ncbi:DUF1302 domain-containing protein [Endozoicomonas arenosclerae]|uniref:DUF1302 domain-containing protein n=1 Tax=Endozoicomonas arenosclerae TaxID=1633495 RepID=UPI000785A13C|nr:DUF1302 domain-containing protein [Endozoicomonas arenosclerae]
MQKRTRPPLFSYGVVLGCCLSATASAVQFSHGEIDGQLTSQLSIGASWSTEKASDDLIAIGNGGKAFSSTMDDGRLNFDKGDSFSEIFKGVHELSLNYRNYGAFIRGKYWYDRRLKDGNVNHGHAPTGYGNTQRDKKLDDSSFDDPAKFSGAEILDAYVYGEFELGEVLMDLRLGRQVVSWGESTFIRDGINTINPVDLNAFRRPGAEIKEGLRPVNMIYGNFSLSENFTMEAFYQLKWEKTVVDGCGSFFSSSDVVASGCDKLTLSGYARSDEQALAVPNDQGFMSRVKDREPGDSGQYGLAFRYFSPELNDTEFGLYYINYHSRIPFFGGVALNPGVSPAVYAMEFPEDIEVYGFSFSTSVGDYSVAGEISHRPDQPVGLNSTDLLFDAVTGGSTGFIPGRLAPGKSFSGFDRLPVSQAQVTVTRFFDQVLGASRLTLLGEVGYSHTGDLPSTDKVRYGRAPAFGIGKGCNAAVPPFSPASGNDCTKNGYVTSGAWGYRLLAALNYSNVFAGVNLTPKVAFAHDVDGYSATGVFLEDRQALSMSLAADYLNTYTASISYNTFWGGKYNTSKDRDYAAISFGVSF